MNKDNFSALILGVAVVSLIVGFGVYFNSPSLNKASSEQQTEKFVSGATTVVDNGTTITTRIKLDRSQFDKLDKSQFRKAPEFAQISGYINTPNNDQLTLSSLKGK